VVVRHRHADFGFGTEAARRRHELNAGRREGVVLGEGHAAPVVAAPIHGIVGRRDEEGPQQNIVFFMSRPDKFRSVLVDGEEFLAEAVAGAFFGHGC